MSSYWTTARRLITIFYVGALIAFAALRHVHEVHRRRRDRRTFARWLRQWDGQPRRLGVGRTSHGRTYA